jgi:hypothetical protein
MDITHHIAKINKEKLYKQYKYFINSTHLKGTHIDFYHFPYDFGKKTMNTNYLSFRREIVDTMKKMSICEKKGYYLSSHVVKIMIDQINAILTTSNDYWVKFGFMPDEIDDIHKIYAMYKFFLDTYLSNIPNSNIDGLGKTKHGEKLYQFCLYYVTGLKISPRMLQQFAKIYLTKTIDQIKKLTSMSLSDAKQKYTQEGTPIESEKDLFTSCHKQMLLNHENALKMFNNDVVLLNPQKIKIKSVPPLRMKWAPTVRLLNNTIFMNTGVLSIYKKEHLPSICSVNGNIGLILIQNNYHNITKKSTMNDKNKKKYIKYLQSTVKGWAQYIDEIINGTTLHFLFGQLLHCVRMIIDIGINSSDVDICFTVETAKEYMKEYTILNDDLIISEIMGFLSYPGQSCSTILGYHCIKMMKKMWSRSGKTDKDFHSWILNKPLPLDMLFKQIYNKKL